LAGAGELAADIAVDTRGFRMDSAEKFHARSFFHDQVSAVDRMIDFSVCADDQVAGANDRAMDAAEERKVVGG
jgi:hypothetical protein